MIVSREKNHITKMNKDLCKCLILFALPLLLILMISLPLFLSQWELKRRWFRAYDDSRCYGSAIVECDEPLAQIFRLNNLLTREECMTLIALAEQQPWSTARHASYPTTDISVSTVPTIEKALLRVSRELEQKACLLFGFKPGDLWLRDQFVVKYSPKAQKDLQAHRDASSISYVLSLNDHTSYSGGGTTFIRGPAESLQPQKLMAGEAIVFCGKRLHEGHAVTSGTRYIVTGFLDAHTSPDTAMSISQRNRVAIQNIIGRQHWVLSPYMLPTRPYLRSNTYRMLGVEAATKGDLTLAAISKPHHLWPYGRCDSIIHSARSIVKTYGTNLGEEKMHALFHYYLTEPKFCSSTACHMKS